MHYQKLALGIVILIGKNRINSVGKFAVVLLVSLTLPVLVVAESREVALAKLNEVIAQTQTGEEQEQEKLELQELLRLSQFGVEQYKKKQYQEALETFQKALAIATKFKIDSAEAATLNIIGHTYLNLEKHSDALKYLQQALTVSQKIDNKVLEGKNLNDIGLVYDRWKQYTKALDFYHQALKIRKQNGDKVGEATTLNNISSSYYDLAQYPKAVEYMQQALAIRKQIGDQKVERTILYNAGSLYDKLRQYRKALDFYQQALAINHQIKDQAAEGRTLNDIGSVYMSLAEYPKALELYQQALKIRQQIGDKRGEGSTLSNIGNAYFSLAEYPKALECYQQARGIYKQLDKKAEEGIVLGNIGSVYQVLGESSKALEFLQQGLALLEQIGERNEKGKVINNIGVVYRKLGEYPKALELFQQALTIQKQVRDKLGEIPIVNGIGSVYYSLGQYSKALDFYQQALAICKQVGDRSGEGTTLSLIASVYDSLGQHLKALKLYKQALDIHREIGNKIEEGNTLDSMALTASTLELKPEAMKLLQLALDIRKQIGDHLGEATTLNNIGSVYNSSEEYAKALDFFQQSRQKYQQISNKPGEGSTLHNIGSVYDSWGQYPKALEFYQQALIINKKVGSKGEEAASLSNIGYVYLRTGKLAKAIENLSAAIDALELLRPGLKDADKISIIDTQINVYKVLQQAYITQNQYEKALETSERGRARAFVELLAEKQKTQVQAKPTINQLKQIAKEQNATLVEYSIIDEEFKVQGKKQWLESELYIWVIKPTGEIIFRKKDLKPLWQQQNTSLEDTIVETLTSLDSNINSRSSSSSFEVGEFVKPNETLNEFTSDAPWKVIAVDRQNQTVKIQSSARKQEHERKFTEVTKVPYAYAANKKLQELHKILIEPIADSLPKNERDHVIFIPQGFLFFVPFPALQDANRNYLIKKHTIQTSPSIQVLDLTWQQRQKLSTIAQNKPKDVLVVGNPTMPYVPSFPGETPTQLPSLKHAEEEAKQVAQMFKTDAIVGNRATKSAILPLFPKARIIHLATHGLLDDFTGGSIPGAIALAPEPLNKGKDGEINGLLTASEIFDLQLNNTELVVLSACDTGRGKITGDGVIGLSRSFISAGVPSVIVSLWSIPDDSTALLMTEFYKLQQGNDKASALRQAMLTTMEKNPDPKHWAAFTLIGETK
jgi:CHAT domain-containing protein/Tfp pilus assembly protein PilF